MAPASRPLQTRVRARESCSHAHDTVVLDFPCVPELAICYLFPGRSFLPAGPFLRSLSRRCNGGFVENVGRPVTFEIDSCGILKYVSVESPNTQDIVVVRLEVALVWVVWQQE